MTLNTHSYDIGRATIRVAADGRATTTIGEQTLTHSTEMTARAYAKNASQHGCAKHPSSRMVHMPDGREECWTCLHIDGDGEL